MTSLPNVHNAFGARWVRPGVEGGFSVGYRSAENLLVKARRALIAGDDGKAARYIDKAALIPWDDHEEHVPAVVAAEMVLFLQIVNGLDRCVEGEDRWIDAPAAVIDSDSPARRDVATALRDVLITEGSLSPGEKRRVDRLLTACPPFEMGDNEGDLDHAGRVARITTLVRASVDVEVTH